MATPALEHPIRFLELRIRSLCIMFSHWVNGSGVTYAISTHKYEHDRRRLFQFVRQLQKALKSFAIGIGMREQSPCVLHTLLRLFCSCYYCSILRRPRQAVSWRRLETAGLAKCFFFSSGFPSNCNSQHPRYFNFSAVEL